MRRLMPTPFLKLPEFLREGAARYGTLVSFATWWRRFVLVNDPAFVRDVLVTHQHAFRKSVGTASLGLLLGQGLLTSEEPFHRKMRRIVQPAFHRERIASYVETMNEFAGAFVERIEPGAPFDLHAAATELTLRIASTTLFGIDAGNDARDVSEAMHELMEIFPYVAGPIGELRRKFGLAKNERFDRARDRRLIVLGGHRGGDRVAPGRVGIEQRQGPVAQSRQARLFASWKTWTGVDVPDPYYGDDDDFERCLDMIEAGCRGLVAHLAGPDGAGRTG